MTRVARGLPVTMTPWRTLSLAQRHACRDGIQAFCERWLSILFIMASARFTGIAGILDANDGFTGKTALQT